MEGGLKWSKKESNIVFFTWYSANLSKLIDKFTLLPFLPFINHEDGDDDSNSLRLESHSNLFELNAFSRSGFICFHFHLLDWVKFILYNTSPLKDPSPTGSMAQTTYFKVL